MPYSVRFGGPTVRNGTVEETCSFQCAFILIVVIMLVYSHYWIRSQENIEWPSYIYIDDEGTASTTTVSEEDELAYKLARDD